MPKPFESYLDLSGRVAIVTGGGTGIGKAITLELAKAGCDLTIASRKMEHLEQTARQVQSLGRRCLYLTADLRQVDQIENMVQKTEEEYGKVDILVNNAGVNFNSPADKISPNGWNTILSINLTGAFLCSRTVFPIMARQKKGNIINIASVGGEGARPLACHYGASKAGMINLTQSLAAEWAVHGIRVNCIAPGPILTEGIKGVWKLKDGDPSPFPITIGRWGYPEEIGYAAVFMASEASSYITGAVLDVAGGCRLPQMA